MTRINWSRQCKSRRARVSAQAACRSGYRALARDFQAKEDTVIHCRWAGYSFLSPGMLPRNRNRRLCEQAKFCGLDFFLLDRLVAKASVCKGLAAHFVLDELRQENDEKLRRWINSSLWEYGRPAARERRVDVETFVNGGDMVVDGIRAEMKLGSNFFLGRSFQDLGEDALLCWCQASFGLIGFTFGRFLF